MTNEPFLSVVENVCVCVCVCNAKDTHIIKLPLFMDFCVCVLESMYVH